MMPGSSTNVAMVRKTRITPAPTVQPISSRVLPWIWAATRPFLARYLMMHQKIRPSTPMKMTRAMTPMML